MYGSGLNTACAPRGLENRRKTAQFSYKKVAAKRFVKVFNRLGRKQSKEQIPPLCDALRLPAQESSLYHCSYCLIPSIRLLQGCFCTDPQHPMEPQILRSPPLPSTSKGNLSGLYVQGHGLRGGAGTLPAWKSRSWAASIDSKGYFPAARICLCLSRLAFVWFPSHSVLQGHF